MKTSILTLLFFLPFFSHATVWRVDGATNLDADFSDLQVAVDNASAGDTIYVAPNGGASYGGIIVSTSLTIIGSGYFLTLNDSTQNFGSASSIDHIRFEEGSSGSILKGFQLEGFITTYTGTFSSDNLNSCAIILNECCILIEKCAAGPGSGGIGFTARADNCIISKCFFKDRRLDFEGLNVSNSPSLAGQGVSGLMVSNSALGIFLGGTGSFGTNETVLSASFQRCIFTGRDRFGNRIIDAPNTVFTNCIFFGSTDQDYDEGNSVFINCVDENNSIPLNNNNQINVPEDDLFDPLLEDHPELQYSLSETSPARNAANDGGDCGIFDGPDPYVLSGMPDIPSVFELSVDPSGNGNTQSIGVNLKAKSHE